MDRAPSTSRRIADLPRCEALRTFNKPFLTCAVVARCPPSRDSPPPGCSSARRANGCLVQRRGKAGNVSRYRTVTVTAVGTPKMFNWRYVSESGSTSHEWNSFSIISPPERRSSGGILT
jgi:hypothetical protein